MSNEFIPEAEVNNKTLKDLFTRAFIRSETTENESLLSASWDDYVTWITIDHERKFIKLAMFFYLDTNATQSVRLDYINALNSNYILAQFSCDDDGIWGSYFYPFEEGFTPFQFISVFKFFSNLVPAALQKEDKHGLLK